MNHFSANIQLTEAGEQNIRDRYALAGFSEAWYSRLFTKQWVLKIERELDWPGYIYAGPKNEPSHFILSFEDYVRQ